MSLQPAARRFVFMMLDGVGAGELPDSKDYGDAGSDTLGNLSRVTELRLPNLQRLGLGNILPILGVPPVPSPLALAGRLAPLSAGKDTTVGHWEHMGLITERPFPTYPEGFPEEVLAPFRAAIGRGVLANRPASGTAIIAELGEEHLRTGRPIVYTSADSVFQIAAHTDVVPLELLYHWCERARDILTGPHAVARVIARPFTGPPGAFTRTKDRRDFSLAPPSRTYLDLLHEAGVPVLALGKISEVFLGRGIASKIKVASNDDNLSLVIDLLRGTSDRGTFDEGLLFTNLVDFDMVWGHRNDSDGFALGLATVDRALDDILAALGPHDRLILSADHGVDPTTPSTDHSREYAPLLLHPRPAATPQAVYEGFFSDTGATVHEYLTSGTGKTGTAIHELAGRSLLRLSPDRGWRRNTPVQPSPVNDGSFIPGRVGPKEAQEAAKWLRDRLGPAPRWAVILGSGLASAFVPGAEGASAEEIPYSDIPHWPSSTVPGHLSTLSIADLAGRPLAVLRGRAHGYEGFDLSQTQMAVRTLARWGVEGLVASSAAGAVSHDLAAGDLAMVCEILDLQHMAMGGPPLRLAASDRVLTQRLCPGMSSDTSDAPARAVDTTPGPPADEDRQGPMTRATPLTRAVHAAVPGPQYETRAELRVLRALGVDSVSMSLAAETLAARDEGLRLAAVAVISNAGPPSHEEVLAGAASAAERFRDAVKVITTLWDDK